MKTRMMLAACCTLAIGLLPHAAQADDFWTPPPSVVVERNIQYGSHNLMRYDVYKPRIPTSNAPVIVMVHGGGWYQGDKRLENVVANKVEHYVPKGFVFISVNYRLVPGFKPDVQKADVAMAINHAQTRAANYGGDPKKFVVMGHSAGGHLVSMVATTPLLLSGYPAPYLGTVSLDAGALDVVEVMEAPHAELFDDAFGAGPENKPYWIANSPFHQLGMYGAPAVSKNYLAVCSLQRFNSCYESKKFVDKYNLFTGYKGKVLERDLSHEEINDLLGEDEEYTGLVDAWLSNLHPDIARLLR